MKKNIGLIIAVLAFIASIAATVTDVSAFLVQYEDWVYYLPGTPRNMSGTIAAPGGGCRAILKYAKIDNYGDVGGVETTLGSPFSGSADLGFVTSITWHATEASSYYHSAEHPNGTGLNKAIIDWLPEEPADSSLGPPDNGSASGSNSVSDLGAEGPCTLPGSVGQPINVATGNMYHREVDFEYSGFLKLERWYNSQKDEPAGFGNNWTHNYETSLVQEPGRLRVASPTGRSRYFQSYSTSFYPFPSTGGRWAVEGAGSAETLYDGTSNHFDADGRLTRVEDQKGGYIALEYISQPDNTVTIFITDEFGRYVSIHKNTYGRIDQVTDPAGLAYAYSYDETGGPTDGNLLSVTYPDGSTRNYYYEQSGDFPHRLTRIEVSKDSSTRTVAVWRYGTGAPTYEPDGYAVESSTDGTNNLVSLAFSNSTTVVTDSLGRAATYVYEDFNGIKKTVSVEGDCGCSKGSAGYDHRGNLSWRMNERGVMTNYSSYDSRDNPLCVINAANTQTPIRTYYTYHPETSAPTSISRVSVLSGNYTARKFMYDGFNNLTGVSVTGYTRDINGATLQFAVASHHRYNPRGQLTNSTDPLGRSVTFSYYSTTWGGANHGRLKSVTNAIGHTVGFGNYSTGRPGWMRDENGVVTRYSYNARGRLSTVGKQGRTFCYGYDAFGNMTSMTLPRGNRIGYGYDTANRLVRVSDGLGNYIAYEYDTEGNRTREEVRDSSGTLVKYQDMAYDADDRLWRVTNPGGAYAETLYDESGNLTSFRDFNGNITGYAYDAFNRIRALVQPEPVPGFGNVSTTFGHDRNGNVTSVTDGNGNATAYTYDDLGRLVETVSPDTGTTRYEYDAAGNLVKKRDAAGTLLSYEYDELNRLTAVRFPDSNQDITYSYDSPSVSWGIGRLTGMTDPSGATAYHYDVYGQMVKEEKTFTGLPGTTFTTQYSFDANGNLETMTYPDGRVMMYSYDDADRLTGISGEKDGTVKGFASDIARMPFGGISGFTFGNGLAALRTYDELYRLSHLKSGPMIRREYGLDDNGNITSVVDLVHPEKSQTYSYDSLGRLRQADGPWGSILYSLDAVGNRTGLDAGTPVTYTYQPGTNRLVSLSTGESFVYDTDGALTSDGTLDYAYNQNGRLIKAIDTATQSTLGEYVYDGMGRRAKKTAGGETTYFIYEISGKLIAEYDGAGGWVSNRAYLYGEPLVRFDAGVQNPAAASASPYQSSVCLSWEPVAGAAYYIVCWGDASGVYPNCGAQVSGASYCVEGLSGSEWYLVVRAYDTGGVLVGQSDEAVATLVAPDPELPHFSYDARLGGGSDCGVCHMPAGTFMSGFGVRTSVGLCQSCHNPAGVGHGKPYGGTDGHPVFVNVTADASHRLPTLGSVTGMGSDKVTTHLFGGRQVVCMSCHNAMAKPNDPGRSWEYTTTADDTTYRLEKGGWAYYSYLKPIVYLDTALWEGPAELKERRTYIAPESGYEADPVKGEIIFKTRQPAGTYVYVTLENDYLRSTNVNNQLCLDCHVTGTHKGADCTACHGTHNTDNLANVREELGTPKGTYNGVVFESRTAMGGGNGVCTVCHTTTMYHNVTALSPAGHFDSSVCTDCHQHRRGFSSFTSVFNPVKRRFFALFGVNSAYAKPPAWAGREASELPPGLLGHSLPAQAWANGLIRFQVDCEVVNSPGSSGTGISPIKDDIILYYHNDHLGTPCFLTDETGAIVWRREQTPFGEETLVRGKAGEDLRFPGQLFDRETGQHYNGFRTYSPLTGRYLEPDPIGQAGGINPYPYAGVNPTGWSDPSGLDPQDYPALQCHVCTHNDPMENLVGGAIVTAPLIVVAGTGETALLISAKIASSPTTLTVLDLLQNEVGGIGSKRLSGVNFPHVRQSVIRGNEAHKAISLIYRDEAKAMGALSVRCNQTIPGEARKVRPDILIEMDDYLLVYSIKPRWTPKWHDEVLDWLDMASKSYNKPAYGDIITYDK